MNQQGAVPYHTGEANTLMIPYPAPHNETQCGLRGYIYRCILQMTNPVNFYKLNPYDWLVLKKCALILVSNTLVCIVNWGNIKRKQLYTQFLVTYKRYRKISNVGTEVPAPEIQGISCELYIVMSVFQIVTTEHNYMYLGHYQTVSHLLSYHRT